MHILVAEDQTFWRNAITNCFKLNGHSVTEASSQNEALSLIDMDDFDFVLTDRYMPKMSGEIPVRESGIRVIQARRYKEGKSPALPKAEIWLMTGDLDEETVVQGKSAGANEVFAKEFLLKKLRERGIVTK